MIGRNELTASLGIFIGIGAVAFVSDFSRGDLLWAPFGATSVIAFFDSESRFAQPRNIILGYFLTSSVGAAAACFSDGQWYDYALAVAAALLLKSLFGAVHPPSAAMPVLLIQIAQAGGADKVAYYVYGGVLPGIFVLAFTAVVYNRYILRRDYPLWRRRQI